MKRIRFDVLILLAFAIAAAHAPAATAVASTDPLAAIDLNRGAIIADIVQGFDGDRAALATRLAGLRADRLLAASLASTRGSLESILVEAQKSRDAAPSRAGAKALGSANADLVYTPVTPCRLIDTRGFGAPIQGGPFAPDARRSYAPNGLCGLPATGVATILVSFTTQNLTPNSGGYLALLAPGAPVTTTADIFNLGSEWSASTTAIATGPAAQFDVVVAVASAQVVVDVLGYFAPPQGGAGVVTTLGTSNTFVGRAGNATMPGANNTAVGDGVLFSNTTGNGNTGVGAGSLSQNRGGSDNTATGAGALAFNNASGNTAVGSGALTFNGSGAENTAIGAFALNNNANGIQNTATGAHALAFNTSGQNNTAMGHEALLANSTGVTNTAIGASALTSNTNGSSNTATGGGALLVNTIGDRNTANGSLALLRNTTGNLNTALGMGALSSNTAGSRNIAVGFQAGSALTTGNLNIAIGNAGDADESNTIRIGDFNQTRTFVAGIRGTATGVGDGVAVFIDSQGQLGTLNSSRRFKDDVADMGAASSALMKLRPVTFHYKADTSAAGRTLQYGLIAEEVADLYPGLVAHSPDGKVETVMYQFLPAMLLNEVQKQQRTLQAQAARIAALEEQAARMAVALERLAPAQVAAHD